MSPAQRRDFMRQAREQRAAARRKGFMASAYHLDHDPTPVPVPAHDARDWLEGYRWGYQGAATAVTAEGREVTLYSTVLMYHPNRPARARIRGDIIRDIEEHAHEGGSDVRVTDVWLVAAWRASSV